MIQLVLRYGPRMIRLQQRERGPYFADFSLPIPDRCVDIVKIRPRSPIVSLSNPQVRQAPKGRRAGDNVYCRIENG